MAHRCGVRSVAGFAHRLSPSRLPRRCQQQREARDPRNSVDNVAVLSHPLDETPRRRVPAFYRFPLFGRAHRAAAAVAHGARLVLWQPWRTLSATCLDSARRLCLAGCAFGHARTRAVLSCAECACYTCPHHRCYWEPDDGILMRTAKGHTGGPLTVGQLEVLAFLLVQVAAVVRVFGGLLMPSQYMITVVVSAFCWAGAFALYAAPYWPLLSRPRWTENQDKARFRSLHQDARASAERRRRPKPSHRYTCS